MEAPAELEISGELIDDLVDEDELTTGVPDLVDEDELTGPITHPQPKEPPHKTQARAQRLGLTEDLGSAAELVLDNELSVMHNPELRQKTITNYDNDTQAPVILFQLVDPAGANPNTDRNLWGLILNQLTHREWGRLAKACRTFRQLTAPLLTGAISTHFKPSEPARAIKYDLCELVSLWHQQGKLEDLTEALVCAIHYKSPQTLYYLTGQPHNWRDALRYIAPLDSLAALKVYLAEGAEIDGADIKTFIEADAVSIFSYLVQSPSRLLLSVAIRRDRSSLENYLSYALDVTAPKIVAYLASLGFSWTFNVQRWLSARSKRVAWPVTRQDLHEDQNLAQILRLQSANISPLDVASLIARSPCIETLRVLHELGYDVSIDLPSFEPSLEREIFRMEQGIKLSSRAVDTLVVDHEAFRKAHELGYRGTGEAIVNCFNHACEDYIASLKLVHEYGYRMSADQQAQVNQAWRVHSPEVIHYFLKQGYNVQGWAVTWYECKSLSSAALEELHQAGFRWNADDIKQAFDQDNVDLIAASVNLGIWEAGRFGNTNLMLWVIAARARKCFEYLITRETLSYSAQAYVFRGGKSTETLSPNFPTDWLCLAYYMPWLWMIRWVNERASEELKAKIEHNAKEWTHTWGLDKLIPNRLHALRNYIAQRLLVDGRPQVMRALLNGRELPPIAAEMRV